MMLNNTKSTELKAQIPQGQDNLMKDSETTIPWHSLTQGQTAPREEPMQGNCSHICIIPASFTSLTYCLKSGDVIEYVCTS